MGLARGLLCGFACGLVLPLVCVFNVDVWLNAVVCLVYALIGLWISVVVLCRVLWCSARLFVAMILVVRTCLVDGFGGMAFDCRLVVVYGSLFVWCVGCMRVLCMLCV